MKLGIIFYLLISINIAVAGPKVGNGGGAWACINKDGDTYSWIQIIDLFEMENEFHEELKDYEGQSVQEILSDIENKILSLNQTNSSITNLFEFILNKMEFVSALLPKTEDIFNRISPSKDQCPLGEVKYLQIAIYTIRDELFIQEDYWGLLSNRDKAALIVHEATYKYLRETFGDDNSIRTRKIVGLLFLNLTNSEIKKELPLLI